MADQQPRNTQGGEQRCPWCGAPNAADATRCASCGSWLVSNIGPIDEDGGAVIDVTGSTPEIISDEPPQERVTTYTFSGGRGFAITGGRNCTLMLILLGLFLCVQCVLAYWFFRWVF